MDFRITTNHCIDRTRRIHRTKLVCYDNTEFLKNEEIVTPETKFLTQIQKKKLDKRSDYSKKYEDVIAL